MKREARRNDGVGESGMSRTTSVARMAVFVLALVMGGVHAGGYGDEDLTFQVKAKAGSGWQPLASTRNSAARACSHGAPRCGVSRECEPYAIRIQGPGGNGGVVMCIGSGATDIAAEWKRVSQLALGSASGGRADADTRAPAASAATAARASAVATAEGSDFVRNCPHNPFARITSDCACIESKLRAMPAPTPGKPPAEKPTRLAAEACALDAPAMSRNMADSLRDGPMSAHADCIGQRFANAYRAKPQFNQRYIEGLRADAYRACSGKAATGVVGGATAAKPSQASPAARAGQDTCALIGERLAAARQKGGGLSLQMLQAAARRAGCGGG